MKNARLTDISVGVCCCHSGCIGEVALITTHSPNVVDNDLNQGRLTDISISSCGHVGLVVTASNDTITNDLGNARITDMVVGCFTNVQVVGSPDTTVND